MSGDRDKQELSDDGWGDDPPIPQPNVPQIASGLGGPQGDQIDREAVETSAANEHQDQNDCHAENTLNSSYSFDPDFEIDLTSINGGEKVDYSSEEEREHVELDVPEQTTPQNTGRSRFNMDRNETPILRQWGDDTSVSSSFWQNEPPPRTKEDWGEHWPPASTYLFRPDSPEGGEISGMKGDQTRRVNMSHQHGEGRSEMMKSQVVGQVAGDGHSQRKAPFNEGQQRPKAARQLTYAEFAGWTKLRQAETKTVEIGGRADTGPEDDGSNKENMAPVKPVLMDVSTSSTLDRRDCSVQTIQDEREMEDKATQTSPIRQTVETQASFEHSPGLGTITEDTKAVEEGTRQNEDGAASDQLEANIMEQAEEAETDVEEKKEVEEAPPRPSVVTLETDITTGDMQLADGIQVAGGEVSAGERTAADEAPALQNNNGQTNTGGATARFARTNVHLLALNAMISALQGIELVGQRATERMDSIRSGTAEK